MPSHLLSYSLNKSNLQLSRLRARHSIWSLRKQAIQSNHPETEVQLCLPRAVPAPPSGITFTSVTKVTDHLPHVCEIASLFADCFFDTDDVVWERGGLPDGLQPHGLLVAAERVVYGARAVLYLLSQHVAYGPHNHVTLLAWQQASAQHQGQVRRLVGMGSVTLDEAVGDLPAALAVKKYSPWALLANLAVRPEARRQGLGAALVAECERVASQWRSRAPSLCHVCLLVSRSNREAIRLYQRCGYAENMAWVDSRWRADAEAGRLGRPRRLLYGKRLA